MLKEVKIRLRNDLYDFLHEVSNGNVEEAIIRIIEATIELYKIHKSMLGFLDRKMEEKVVIKSRSEDYKKLIDFLKKNVGRELNYDTIEKAVNINRLTLNAFIKSLLLRGLLIKKKKGVYFVTEEIKNVEVKKA